MIHVHQSNTNVTVEIQCKDNFEAERVAAEIAADVNEGRFRPKAMSYYENKEEEKAEADPNSMIPDLSVGEKPKKSGKKPSE
jgi:hypothetical protein